MLLLQKHLCSLPDEGKLKDQKRWTPGSPRQAAWVGKGARGTGRGGWGEELGPDSLPARSPSPGHSPGGFAPYTDGYLREQILLTNSAC